MYATKQLKKNKTQFIILSRLDNFKKTLTVQTKMHMIDIAKFIKYKSDTIIKSSKFKMEQIISNILLFIMPLIISVASNKKPFSN